jgi:hypothetical protein
MIPVLFLPPLVAGGEISRSHEESSERVVSLDSTIRVKRDGTVDVEQRFLLRVEGKRIERGPCLNFLTVFRGPAGLVLDNRMEVKGVFRDTQPENYVEKTGGAQRQIFCGAEDVLLEPGLYEYRIAYSALGEWKVQGREAAGVFDFGGPFRGFGIDEATLRVVFPPDTRVLRWSPAVQGFLKTNRACSAQLHENELLVKIAGPLEAKNHAMFVNAVWTAKGFARSKLWREAMRQHPKLPLAAFAGTLLLWALVLLLLRSRRGAAPVSARNGPQSDDQPSFQGSRYW